MDKLQKRIREVEEEHAEESLNQHLSHHNEKQRDNALILLGGFKVVNRIAQSLSSELMRALITFQEEKLYESLGYENFVEFLNNSEYAPMTKSQFYERKTLLEKEGDFTFDLLNSISMSVSKRKLLGKGNVKLEGENVIITDSETGEEISINRHDSARLTEVVTALADSSAELRKKVESQKTKLNSADNIIINLSEEVERVKAEKIAAFENSHSSALMNLVAAFSLLTVEAEKLSAIEKEQFAPRTFETIASLMSRLSDGYNRQDWAKEISKAGKSKVRENPTDDDFLIEQVLGDDAEPDNDSELAEMM